MNRIADSACVPFDALGPGRHDITLVVATDDGGGPSLEVAVHVFVGREPGPRLAVVGGVHGNEYDGIRAAQRLVAETDPHALAGVLVVVPVANPDAFCAGQRFTALDDVDLNRVFPGVRTGRPTQRLAFALVERVLRHMDLVFTLHGGGAESKLSWYLEFLDEHSDVGRRSRAAAMAAGFDTLVAIRPEPNGYLLTALGALGVPVVEGEVGGRGELHAANVDYYLARVAAVAAHLGMAAPSAPSLSTSSSVWRAREVLAVGTGMLQRRVDLGAEVQEGQHLATILDIAGHPVAELHSPCDGRIGGFRGHAWIQEGQTAFRIFLPIESRSPVS